MKKITKYTVIKPEYNHHLFSNSM